LIPWKRFGVTRLRGAAAALALLLACISSVAASRAECAGVQSKILGRQISYCVLLPPSYSTQPQRRFPVLYLLHGLGANEQSFIDSGAWQLIQDLWEQKKIGEFVVVTPQAGTSFYVNSKSGKVRYEDFFIHEFIPSIERKYGIESSRKTRGISGISMGGYGALRTAFKYPQMFGSVSAHSAALIEKLPPNIEAASGGFNWLGPAFGHPFSPQFWESNTPFVFARRNAVNLRSMAIYFDCGSEDQFGFDYGARQLDKQLTSLHIAHQFHIYPGGHTPQYFGQHLPASLAFHSRVFYGK
jgi:S-formylglutathione hydrolase FrmB